MRATTSIGQGTLACCVLGVVGVVGVGGMAGTAHGAIVVTSVSASMSFEASTTDPNSTPINETWSTTSMDPLSFSREYAVPTTMVEPWARAAGTMTTTSQLERYLFESTFTAEASTLTVVDVSASARTVSLATIVFNVTQAGDYLIRGGSNVTGEGFGSFLYNTLVNMTGPVGVHLPAIDGPNNPNVSFVRTLPVGSYTLNTLATIASESGAGQLAALAGSVKFEIIAVPAPGVAGMAMVAGVGVAARRRRNR